MHSFHHSRGRILFEVFCALAVSASLAGAWLQTGASALLAAAAVSALYALVHLSDVRRPRPIGLADAGEMAGTSEAQADAPDDHVVDAETPRQEALAEAVVEEPQIVESAAPKAKAPRKSRPRRASAPKNAEVVQLTPPAQSEALEPRTAEVADVIASEEGADFETLVPAEDMHPHIAPLFEPEPFARMPRRAFGRKAG